MSKLMSSMALGCFVFGLATTPTLADANRGFTVVKNDILFETNKCPDGEEWNEEKQACEKKES